MSGRRDPRATMLRVCRGCGCDDKHACVTDAGPCCWTLMDITTPTGVCSACAIDLDFDQGALAYVGRDDDGEPLVQSPSRILRALA
jgi:hypothetical protein